MGRGNFKVLVVALAVLSASCGGGGGATRLAAVHQPRPTLLENTTTTAVEPAPEPVAPAAPAAARPQRVRALPGDSSPPPVARSSRGPVATGRIIIPSIGLDHQTFEGIDLATIDHGPSHWPGTAMPGEVGNTTFPGHRVTHTHPFFDIDRIRTGDLIIFVNDSGRYTYQATDEFVVTPEDTWIADATPTATFTIFGCHPKHQATHRYVVKGKLIRSERTPAAGGSGSGGDSSGASPPPATTTTTAKPLIPTIVP